MNRPDERLEALDPAADPVRWEALVGTIVQAADGELDRRRASLTLTAAVLQWARPALSAAATIALLFSVGVAVSRSARTPVEDASLAGALVPEELAPWLVDGEQPTVAEVVVALERVVR